MGALAFSLHDGVAVDRTFAGWSRPPSAAAAGKGDRLRRHDPAGRGVQV